MKGKYPGILEDEVVGAQAQELHKHAKELLNEIIVGELLTARSVAQIFPAYAVKDDIFITSNVNEVTCIHSLRRQIAGTSGSMNPCLSDFIAPGESGRQDWLGAFAVSVGFGIPEMVQEFSSRHNEYDIIMAKALADRLAEAMAEKLHQQIREEYWGFAAAENASLDDLLVENYRGIRPAPGYPACPDHIEKETLFEVLGVEKEINIKLTENYAMDPAASVCGWIFSHPDSHYFSVNKIGRDQVSDLAARKNENANQTEIRLQTSLAYDPRDFNKPD